MENWLIPIICIVGAIAGISYYFVKKSKNRKAAQSGADKVRVRQAAQPLIEESGTDQILYAHWEKSETYGRTTKTTYYRYAVAFRDDTLYISPLYIDKKTGQIQLARPSVFSPENLGKVTVRTAQKYGAVGHIDLHLTDKQGKTLFQLDVDTENLNKNNYYPFNILQLEECVAFEQFLTALSGRVAGENPGVDDLIKAGNYASVGIFGAVLSGVGAVLSFFFAPVGVVLTVPGLILSVLGKVKGSKGTVPLIISILCLVCSAVFLWVYLTYPG